MVRAARRVGETPTVAERLEVLEHLVREQAATIVMLKTRAGAEAAQNNAHPHTDPAAEALIVLVTTMRDEIAELRERTDAIAPPAQKPAARLDLSEGSRVRLWLHSRGDTAMGEKPGS